MAWARAERPFNPNRFHYNWHWNWDYGTGEIGNNGIHALDMVRFLLELEAPVRVTSGGGKLFYDDDQQTPDTLVTTFDFPETCVIWEHRIWSKTGFEGESFGIALYGEKGTLVFDRKGWHVQRRRRGIGQGPPERAAAFSEFSRLCSKSTSGPTRTLRKGTRAHACVIWAISPSARGEHSALTRTRKRFSMIPKRTSFLAEPIGNRMSRTS